MNPLERIVKLTFIGTRQVATAGNVAVYESDFELEGASPDERHKVYVDQQLLLPPRSDSEHLTFEDAHEETGLSVSKLKKLVNNGELAFVENGKQRLILRKSLEQYMKQLKAN
jgi:excisionase family DNA binding protein